MREGKELGGASATLPASLRSLPLSQLHGLYEALRTVEGVLDGLLCQPKFQASPFGQDGLNPAGEYLDDVCQQITRMMCDIADHARATEPDAGANRDRIILADEVRLYESTAQVVEVAAGLLIKRH